MKTAYSRAYVPGPTKTFEFAGHVGHGDRLYRALPKKDGTECPPMYLVRGLTLSHSRHKD